MVSEFSIAKTRRNGLVAFLIVLAAGLGGATPGWAESHEATETPSPFMGEYLGGAWTPQGQYLWAGLQVVPLADDHYQAMWYWGGLPGQGGNAQYRVELRGELVDDTMTLRGDNLQIVLRPQQPACVFDAAGQILGQLSATTRTSPTLGAAPPEHARVLFAGELSDELKNARLSAEGNLMVGTETTRPYQDFQLHLEFRLPYMPDASGQGRGNSGLYIQGRYEVQILDSFGLAGSNNECGSLYKTRAPDLNLCLPPLTWQTYDVAFRAARFNATGEKIESAKITLWHNGVPVHHEMEIPDKTGAGSPEGPDPLPIRLQDHGNPVEFRNFWIVELPDTPAVGCTPAPCCSPAAHYRKGRGRRR